MQEVRVCIMFCKVEKTTIVTHLCDNTFVISLIFAWW